MLNELRGTIPVSITARTKKGLTRNCALNNKKYGVCFNYKYITYAEKEWVCWYDHPLNLNDLNITEVNNDTTENN